jgi:hypothetical protein
VIVHELGMLSSFSRDHWNSHGKASDESHLQFYWLVDTRVSFFGSLLFVADGIGVTQLLIQIKALASAIRWLN